MPVFPIALPTSPKVRSIQWEQRSRSAIAASPYTGKQQSYSHAAQWWEFSCDLPPLNQTDSALWVAAMLRLNGVEGTFEFAPTDATPQVAVSGTIIVDAISDYYLDLTGMTGEFKNGDWIQIENGLYRVTTGDVAVAGAATIEVWPRPRAEIVETTSEVEYSAPVGRFRLAGSFSWDMDLAKTYGISIAAREAL